MIESIEVNSRRKLDRYVWILQHDRRGVCYDVVVDDRIRSRYIISYTTKCFANEIWTRRCV